MIIRSSLCFLGFALSCAAHAERLELAEADSADRLVVRAWQAHMELRVSEDRRLTVDYDCKAGESSAADDPQEEIADAAVPVLGRFDEIITLVASEASGHCRLRIAAPATLGAELQVTDEGNISVYGWPGTLAAWLAVGDIRVVNQSGPFSITAMSGAASVELAATSLSADSGVTAANGNIVLVVSGQPAVTIRARAPQGSIETDLGEVFSVEMHNGQEWSTAQLSGGGAVITLRNLNSDIAVLLNQVPVLSY